MGNTAPTPAPTPAPPTNIYARCKHGPIIVDPSSTLTPAMLTNGSSCSQNVTPTIVFVNGGWSGVDKNVGIRVRCTFPSISKSVTCYRQVRVASSHPTMQHSETPSISKFPSTSPSESPSESQVPSMLPSVTIQPSMAPSESQVPSSLPSASMEPSSSPSKSAYPSQIPSVSMFPSTSPSESQVPSMLPSVTIQPSMAPSESQVPSSLPSASMEPSSSPSKSAYPSQIPSVSMFPSTSPSESQVPSMLPSVTIQPSMAPSESQVPSSLPSASMEPSSSPSKSAYPSQIPSVSMFPSTSPSESQVPSMLPSVTIQPSMAPSESQVPSSLPSASMEPSSSPSKSLQPSNFPSVIPSSLPSLSPSELPSFLPSSLPSGNPSSSPSTSSAPTFPAVLIKSQKVKVSFTGLSGTLTVAQLEDIIVNLTKITKDTIVITLRENGMRIDPDNIVVTTTIKSSSRRNIRSLQESTTSIEQEATFDAPTTTVDTTAIDAGITQATTTDSALSGVSVSSILVVEPERKPCDGVNCGNAGKCVLSESNPTQPTCICENTFELTFNSKGKPSCTCGSDKIFNKDANRCFPPPTQAPTSAPFLSPTKSPVKEDEDPCVDDMISTFPLLNVDKEKGCRWLTKNKKKKRIRMEKYCGLDYVDSICPKTCGLC